MSSNTPSLTTSVVSEAAKSVQVPPSQDSTRLRAGTKAFKNTSRAMFVGGFVTFAMLYSMQPLMPMFSHEFSLSPASASSVLSVSTIGLALFLIPASIMADRVGRKSVMCVAISLASILMVLSTFVSGFHQFLVLRAAVGIALSGLPAVAMAYLSEEVDPLSLGQSIGLYISGNALGGMSGRFLSSVLADHFGWRASVLVIGLIGVVGAWEFWRSLPASRHFKPVLFDAKRWFADVKAHFSDAGLPWLFLTAFLLMGCFVSLYNYLGYRLMAAPYNLSPSLLGAIFCIYVVGVWSSAWVGQLADRFGRRNMLWLMVLMMGLGVSMTLVQNLALMIIGIAMFTFGFFGGHSIASSWVGRRALKARALASALYLSAYYLGSSVVGSVSGLMWGVGHWYGVVSMIGLGLIVALLVALKLRSLPPVTMP